MGLFRRKRDAPEKRGISKALHDFISGVDVEYDAIGRRLEATTESDRPAKVLFVITTDGMENASREYSAKRIKEMIQHQTDKYGCKDILKLLKEIKE